MTKKICDSCGKQIIGNCVGVSYDFFRNHKEFCLKCLKPAQEYLKNLFDEAHTNVVLKND